MGEVVDHMRTHLVVAATAKANRPSLAHSVVKAVRLKLVAGVNGVWGKAVRICFRLHDDCIVVPEIHSVARGDESAVRSVVIGEDLFAQVMHVIVIGEYSKLRLQPRSVHSEVRARDEKSCAAWLWWCSTGALTCTWTDT